MTKETIDRIKVYTYFLVCPLASQVGALSTLMLVAATVEVNLMRENRHVWDREGYNYKEFFLEDLLWVLFCWKFVVVMHYREPERVGLGARVGDGGGPAGHEQERVGEEHHLGGVEHVEAAGDVVGTPGGGGLVPG